MPFHLIAQRVDIQGRNDRLRKYHSHSDFLISKFNLPRMLVRVDSTPRRQWPTDLIRLLLEGATIVRFANTFLEAFRHARNFILCAVFIWDNGSAIRYTLFQDQDDPTVCYVFLYQPG